jgi:CRISPR-associated protein (TIGR02710 family)
VPDYVIFLCSPDSERSLFSDAPNNPAIIPSLAQRGVTLTENHYQIVSVSDPQSYIDCVREIERGIEPMISKWKGRGCDLAIDPTGGTKCMSVSLALVARRWNCAFRYVGGTQRDRFGVGNVETGTEILLVSQNPLAVFGYQVAEEAITLAGNYDFQAAVQVLQQRLSNNSLDPAPKNLAALQELMRMFSLWDCFAHRKAANLALQVKKKLSLLEQFLAPTSSECIATHIDQWHQRLSVLASGQKPTRELVEDLLANASRRRRQGRYDDAVARLYRAIEALAQWRLAEFHNLPQTGRIPFDLLPPDLQTSRKPRDDDNTVSLGLQDSYRLLLSFNDPIGRAFQLAKLDDRRTSPLNARNHSILAHGFQPISENACDSLWTSTLQLAAAADLKESGWIQFPQLQFRGVV